MKKLIIFMATLIVCSLAYKGITYTQTRVYMGDFEVTGLIKSLDHYSTAEITAPGTPASGFGIIYSKTDGKLYHKNDAGTESDLTAGAAGGDSISIDTVAVVDPDFASTGDIDFVDTSNTITANINAGVIVEADLNVTNSPTDNYVLSYNAAGSNFTWAADAGGAETNSLETTITGILDTEFLIGTGTDTANYVVLSGDITSTNAGVVTVADDSHNHVIANIDAMTSAALAGQISDETGSGLAVFATSPTLTTPTLGVATATTINKVTLTAPATAATITATDGTTTTLSGGTHSGTNTGDNTVATSGDSATSFFSSGVLEVGIGGTGATTLNDLIALTTHTTGNYAAGDAEAGNALTGDAALDFFGAGVTAVTDGTACTDIEGTLLSITAGTLNAVVNTADIADVSVTATELAELETIGATTISANQWAALGGIAETLTSTELDLLDGITTLSGSNTGDEVSANSTTEGIAELATTVEIDTGTDTTRIMPIDQFVASKRNIRWLVFNLVEKATDCAAATNIAGDFLSPIAGTILQSDTTPFYLYATNSTAGTTGTMVVDISIGGTSIMTTNKLDFDTTEKTTTTAATMPDLTTTSLAVGDIITIDVDSIHTTAAKGLTVYMAIRE